MLIQTLAFVSFNKVCTAQYFVWWIALLPLALINSDLKDLKRKKLILVLLLWFILELSWNVGAYLLEIRGVSAFNLIFVSCFGFFMANIYLMYVLITHHKPRLFMR
jgi:phosphatidylinositol glycan class M